MPEQHINYSTGPSGSKKGEYPVFIKSDDLPQMVIESKHAEYSVAEAAMKVVGADAFRGLMICEFSGRRGERPSLWKLFFWNEVARAKVISCGLTFKSSKVEVFNQNPLKRGLNEFGDDIDETKVTFSNIPPSFDDSEIVNELKKRGYSVTSKAKKDFIRKPDGKLSAKEAGRILIWIEVPSEPLPKVMKIGPITAKVYHKEQKYCDNCHQYGHLKRNCKNKTACNYCKEEGHKMKDCVKYIEMKRQEEEEMHLAELEKERQIEQRRKEEEERKKKEEEKRLAEQKEREKIIKEELEKEMKRLEELERIKIAQEEQQRKQIEEQKKKEEEEQKRREALEKEIKDQEEIHKSSEENMEEEPEIIIDVNSDDTHEDKADENSEQDKEVLTSDQAENVIEKEEKENKATENETKEDQGSSGYMITSEYFEGSGSAPSTRRPIVRCQSPGRPRSPSIKRKNSDNAKESPVPKKTYTKLFDIRIKK